MSSGATVQDMNGVTITYSPKNNWVTPDMDYASLLSEISQAPSSSSTAYLPLFTSKVGIGRIALMAFALGTVFGLHLLLLVWCAVFSSSPMLLHWACYGVAMCVYHLLEFLNTARNHPGAANSDSFLLNHSRPFAAALIASWLEYWLESLWLFPDTKFATSTSWVLLAVGLGLVVGGQLVRSAAMWQAGPSFTHLLAYERQNRHQLVTSGLYSVLRHPSYFGWFYWSIGTQLVLCNPVCAVAYAAVAWRFFYIRLQDEEESLVDMFGDEYVQYKQRTVVGIPFLG